MEGATAAAMGAAPGAGLEKVAAEGEAAAAAAATVPILELAVEVAAMG